MYVYTRLLLACPLFGGLSSFGVSLIGGFTVLTCMCVCVFVQYESGPVNHLTEDLSRLGESLPPLELEESGLPSLADLSTTDLKYQSYSMKGPGDTGCSLRYFSIQPLVTVRPGALLTQHTEGDVCVFVFSVPTPRWSREESWCTETPI